MDIEREMNRLDEVINLFEKRKDILNRIENHQSHSDEWHYKADGFDAVFRKEYRSHARRMAYCHSRCMNRMIKIYENTTA